MFIYISITSKAAIKDVVFEWLKKYALSCFQEIDVGANNFNSQVFDQVCSWVRTFSFNIERNWTYAETKIWNWRVSNINDNKTFGHKLTLCVVGSWISKKKPNTLIFALNNSEVKKRWNISLTVWTWWWKVFCGRCILNMVVVIASEYSTCRINQLPIIYAINTVISWWRAMVSSIRCLGRTPWSLKQLFF